MNAPHPIAGLSPASIPAATSPLSGGGREPRSYEIEPTVRHDGLLQGLGVARYQAFWLHTSGDGHWCIGGREAGRFLTRDNAEMHGRFWIETGRTTADIDGRKLFEDWKALATDRQARADARRCNISRRHGLRSGR